MKPDFNFLYIILGVTLGAITGMILASIVFLISVNIVQVPTWILWSSSTIPTIIGLIVGCVFAERGKI